MYLNGAPRRIRTPDLLIRSQTLYPAELGAHALSKVGRTYAINFANASTKIRKIFANTKKII